MIVPSLKDYKSVKKSYIMSDQMCKAYNYIKFAMAFHLLKMKTCVLFDFEILI